MGESGAAKCAMGLIIVFNTVFILHGMAFIAAGIVAMVLGGDLRDINILDDQLNKAEYIRLIVSSLFYVFIAIIVYGAIILIFGIVGCVGAFSRNKGAIGTYIYCMVFYLLVYTALGVLILLGTMASKPVIKELFSNETRAEFYSNQLTNEIQILGCCGADGPSDYDIDNLPISCCVLNNSVPLGGNATALQPSDALDYDKCRQTDGAPTYRYDEGCVDFLYYYAWLIMAVIFGLAGLELLLIFLACCLCHTTRKGKQEDFLKHKY